MYRGIGCPNCGRNRVQLDGICEKCDWDADGGDYVAIARPNYCRHSPTGEHVMEPRFMGEQCKYCLQ